MITSVQITWLELKALTFFAYRDFTSLVYSGANVWLWLQPDRTGSFARAEWRSFLNYV